MESFVASDMVPITPGDAASHPYDSLYVTVGGDVHFLSARGVERTVTFAATSFIPVRILRVFATGTTATGIFGVL